MKGQEEFKEEVMNTENSAPARGHGSEKGMEGSLGLSESLCAAPEENWTGRRKSTGRH